MSSTETAPVTIERIAAAMESMGIYPFISTKGQVAALLANRTIRVVVPEGHPIQGVSDYPRFFDVAHAEELAESVRVFNATTYIPKATTLVTDEGKVAVRLFHAFNWPAGGTDAQIKGELQQFILSTVALQNRLDVQYPDQWGKEASNA